LDAVEEAGYLVIAVKTFADVLGLVDNSVCDALLQALQILMEEPLLFDDHCGDYSILIFFAIVCFVEASNWYNELVLSDFRG
jgi:hypothetical protein